MGESHCTKRVETDSHAQRNVGRVGRWWHLLTLMVKVTYRQKPGRKEGGQGEREREKKVLECPHRNILPGVGVLSHAADDIPPQNNFPY